MPARPSAFCWRFFSSPARTGSWRKAGLASPRNNNMGLVNWSQFDAYQTAGLLGRGILWGTQPLLWIFFAQALTLERTTAVSLTFFWIYLGALFASAILLGLPGSTTQLAFLRSELRVDRPVRAQLCRRHGSTRPASGTRHFLAGVAALSGMLRPRRMQRGLRRCCSIWLVDSRN